MGREKPNSPPPGVPPGAVPVVEKTTEQKGRPGGTNGPRQTTKKPTPIGASELYSVEKIKENITLAQKLENEVSAFLRKKHGKRKLSNKQKEIASEISNIIVANETPENWIENIEKYCENPADGNTENIQKIQEIQVEHQIDSYLASILYASKV